MATVRKTTLRDMVIRADPQWPATKDNVVEYRWSNDREFKGFVPKRGLYGDGITSDEIDNPGATPVP